MVSPLKKWFAAQREKQAAAVWLDEALFGGRFVAYVLHRLRVFVARVIAELASHAVEFFLVITFLPRRVAIAVLMVRGVGMLISAFWWGGLERMRGEIRTLHRERMGHRIPQVIELWLGGTIVVAAGGLPALILLAGLSFLLFEIPSAAQALLLVMGIEVLAGLVVRTYHSGAYAVRRIFRPIWLVLIMQIVSAGLALSLKPILGLWALPLAAAVNALLSFAVTWFFVGQAYAYLRLFPLHVKISVRRFGAFLRRCDAEFEWAGFARALAQSEWLIVVALLVAALVEDRGSAAWAAVYLSLPLVGASREWAQLFYFDIKKLGPELFWNVREYFECLVERVAVVTGVIGCAGSCLIMAFILPGVNWWVAGPILMVLFVMQSLFAYEQVRAFANRRYQRLATSSVVFLLVLGIPYLLLQNVGYTAAAAVVAMLLGIRMLRAATEHESQHSGVLPTGVWAYRLGRCRMPLKIGAVHLRPNSNRWMAGKVARKCQSHIGNSGATTIVGDQIVVWFCQRDVGKGDPGQKLLASAAGAVSHVSHSEVDKPDLQSVSVSLANELRGIPTGLPTSLGRVTSTEPPRSLLDSLAVEFTSRSSGNMVIPLLERMRIPAGSPKPDMRGVLSAAMRSAEFGPLSQERFANRVSTLCLGGRLVALFISGRKHRSGDWRKVLFQAELAANLRLGSAR